MESKLDAYKLDKSQIALVEAVLGEPSSYI